MSNNSKKLPKFSERFHDLRGKTSQAAFAQKVGISRPTVGFYENGDRLPDAEAILKICKACGVSSDYLLGLTDDPAPASERSALDELGLSPEAVELLLRANMKTEHAALSPLISEVLTNPSFMGMLLSLLAMKSAVDSLEWQVNLSLEDFSAFKSCCMAAQKELSERFGHPVNVTGPHEYYYEYLTRFTKEAEALAEDVTGYSILPLTAKVGGNREFDAWLASNLRQKGNE